MRFKDAVYLGDPRNVVRIFNDKEVDELSILDVVATREARDPSYELIREIVSEAFMPVSYGGGIRRLDQIRTILSIGVEKVVICSYAAENASFIREAAQEFGSQSIVVCIDAKRTMLGGYDIRTRGGQKREGVSPAAFAREMEAMGAGELIINSIDRDGTFEGYDLDLIRSVTKEVQIPVIASGGACKVEDFRAAVRRGGASAVGAGSMFVFHGKHRAVLISFPDAATLKATFEAAGS